MAQGCYLVPESIPVDVAFSTLECELEVTKVTDIPVLSIPTLRYMMPECHGRPSGRGSERGKEQFLQSLLFRLRSITGPEKC